MDQLIERGCGLDVHKKSVAACVRVPGERRQLVQHVRTFGTTASELLALRDWLEGHGVTHVAMESTGGYWKPVYAVLEDAFTCVVVNATHMAQVPGRKTDVQDCVWIAQLLEHGLLRGSFVPSLPIRDLRDVTRYRKTIVQKRSRAIHRLHKCLEDADIKLASVATDVLGVSGRAMLEALIGGTTAPDVLAELAARRASQEAARPAPGAHGPVSALHAFLVSQILAHLDYLEETIETLSQHVGLLIAPFHDAVERLMTIPGVKQRTAEVIVAEIGPDLRTFPSAVHLASWAGLCPGNNESAGKHRPGTTRRGDPWLRTSLTEAALGAIRHGRGALAARYRRIMRHRGHKKAVIAVAHAILIVVYHLLTRQTRYEDLGDNYYDQRSRDRAKRRALATLARQGYHVTLCPTT